MKTTNKYKVILADDHVMVRDALHNLIDNFENFTVSGIADNGKKVQQLLQNGTAADIIVLDLSMPEMDGYETSAWLVKHYPQIKILVLSMHNNDKVLARLLQHGVHGFIDKGSAGSELKKALESIAETGCYYNTEKIASFLKKSNNSPSALVENTLSQTEIDFLKLACSDMTYKEIAGLLNLSLRTVESYQKGLFEKLSVQSRTSLAVYAIRNGIVDL
jgi:two-component system, NarL family, invasion response regulator UvrY